MSESGGAHIPLGSGLKLEEGDPYLDLDSTPVQVKDL